MKTVRIGKHTRTYSTVIRALAEAKLIVESLPIEDSNHITVIVQGDVCERGNVSGAVRYSPVFVLGQKVMYTARMIAERGFAVVSQ